MITGGLRCCEALCLENMSAGLNISQLQAVHYTQGPSLVLAGAGSGKTRVITQKIAHLIAQGIAPQGIAAITFTNKAAAEMRERTKQLVGKRAQDTLICTFHSLGVRLLREHGDAIGLKQQFSILGSDDVLGILKDCGGSTDTSQVRQWQWQISSWKNDGLDSSDALRMAKSEDERALAVLMQRYEERLAAYQSVDFDDLIGLPLKMLQRNEAIRNRWQIKLEHVLVDEYQDTNATQYELLKLLVGSKAHFTAVGDDDQSIYGWRGATLDNLRKLPVDFPQLNVIKLEQNYRSTSAILRAANAVISSNPKLFEKTLFSELGEGEPVRVLACDNEEHEAERVVARIQSLRGTSQHRTFKDFAILYRANHQAKIFEQALRKAQIPYKVSGGQSFFERAEIKDLCAWLRLLSNNNDDPAFLRAVTTPKRGIGHQTLAQLGAFAASHKLSMFEAIFSHSISVAVSSRSLGSLQEFGRFLNDTEFNARGVKGADEATAFLRHWLKELGYEQHLFDTEDNEKLAAVRWKNVLEFCDWMAKRCGGITDDTAGTTTTTAAKTLIDVVQSVALLSTLTGDEKEEDVVTLSTLHAAKGLEWPHVCLVGVNEGLLPFRSDSDDDAAQETQELRIQEERRLMYVGITRAQRTLMVSWLKRRKKGRESINGKPSRFIDEMALDLSTVREDPRERLKALRAEFAKRASAEALPPN